MDDEFDLQMHSYWPPKGTKRPYAVTLYDGDVLASAEISLTGELTVTLRRQSGVVGELLTSSIQTPYEHK